MAFSKSPVECGSSLGKVPSEQLCVFSKKEGWLRQADKHCGMISSASASCSAPARRDISRAESDIDDAVRIRRPKKKSGRPKAGDDDQSALHLGTDCSTAFATVGGVPAFVMSVESPRTTRSPRKRARSCSRRPVHWVSLPEQV